MQTMSYAQALNEAKQMIVQQQLRIKADADKIRTQQQTIVDQSGLLAESDKRLKETSAELQRMIEESSQLSNRLQEMTTAREQAEAMLDRQGIRLTSMQEQISDLERRLSEQSSQLASVSSELEATRNQLPTREDQEALAAMNELLIRKAAASARRSGSSPSMAYGSSVVSSLRLSEDVGGEIIVQSEAA